MEALDSELHVWPEFILLKNSGVKWTVDEGVWTLSPKCGVGGSVCDASWYLLVSDLARKTKLA